MFPVITGYVIGVWHCRSLHGPYSFFPLCTQSCSERLKGSNNKPKWYAWQSSNKLKSIFTFGSHHHQWVFVTQRLHINFLISPAAARLPLDNNQMELLTVCVGTHFASLLYCSFYIKPHLEGEVAERRMKPRLWPGRHLEAGNVYRHKEKRTKKALKWMGRYLSVTTWMKV